MSKPERKLHPSGISKARTWRGHSRRRAAGRRSCRGRAWWTGRELAAACPGRSCSIWKPWRLWPRGRCSTSQPSTGSTWRCGAGGCWCLGGWERRRSPSWKGKQGSAQFRSSLQDTFVSHRACLPKAGNVLRFSNTQALFINELGSSVSIFYPHFTTSPIITGIVYIIPS